MVTEYISVLLIQIVLHFRWTDLLDWKNTQLLHQLQKKVTYSLNFTLGNCKNPGLVTVILGYRMLAGAPHRVVCQPLKSSSRTRAPTTTTAVRKQKASWYYLHVRHVFWFITWRNCPTTTWEVRTWTHDDDVFLSLWNWTQSLRILTAEKFKLHLPLMNWARIK